MVVALSSMDNIRILDPVRIMYSTNIWNELICQRQLYHLHMPLSFVVLSVLFVNSTIIGISGINKDIFNYNKEMWEDTVNNIDTSKTDSWKYVKKIMKIETQKKLPHTFKQ